MPKRRKRCADKSGTRITISGVWIKYDLLRTLRNEVTMALLSDDRDRNSSLTNASIYEAMLDPIDAELTRLRQLAVTLEAVSRKEIREKAQILRDVITAADERSALRLAKSLADDIVQLF